MREWATPRAATQRGAALVPSRGRVGWSVVWVAACSLPLVGLVSLLLRSSLDPDLTNAKVHFVLFLSVAVVDFALASSTAEAARRRGDARVVLISVAFLATGCFLGLHAIGTQGILFAQDLAGFKVAIPVGLIIAAGLAVASAFVDVHPRLGAVTVANQHVLRWAVVAAAASWFVYTITKAPPINGPLSEGARGSVLAVLAGVGAAAYAVAAVRYWGIYRRDRGLLPATVVTCFVLLGEAMIGVAVTGERSWHASWWEWHGLIVIAFGIVGFAAHLEWHDERFRRLYLPTTREHTQELSVLFSDLAGFTPFTERSRPVDVATMLQAYFELAAPLISQQFGGEVEKFIGDAVMATFNTRGDQPDHAVRAAGAALALQRQFTRLNEIHPGWPRLRVGVNSGHTIVREMGARGHVVYAAVGDVVNIAQRLESQAPVGGVLIGTETFRHLPDGAVVESVPGVRVNGRDASVDAYVLISMP
jgi:class 3 adenylate cyclase